jgi:chromate transporter
VNNNDLLTLALVFLRLGLLAFGGSTGLLPELERQVVSEHGWLTPKEFSDSFALGQLTPGPALLMVMFAGFKVAGLAGAVVALVAIFLPSALMTCLVTARWESMRRSPWLAAAQRGLAGVAFGLTAAGAYTIVHVAVTDVVSATIAVGAFLVLWLCRFPPALVILLGGLAAVGLGASLEYLPQAAR